jgi:uncharacterized protein
MNIGITGGTGFVGRAVCRAIEARGDGIVLFSRRAGPGRRSFSITTPPDVSGCDGIVHLAGEPIVGLWTREKRRRILESRVEGTRRLVEGIASAAVKPRVLVSASAIGFYGDTGDRVTDETSPAGSGFLAEVAQAWEAEAAKAESLGLRVVRLRIGFVMGGQGGAMRFLKPLFRLGLGGRLGSGRQWMSCIEVGDLAAIIADCLHDDAVRGAVNAVMPHPVTNREFTAEVARACRRPAIVPAPSLLLRFFLGDLSHLLLDSQRILPAVLTRRGFAYGCPTVGTAVRASL